MLLPLIIVSLLGLSVGSFVNCLVWRLYRQEKVGGRSYCPLCGSQIAWYDNIPLLSYVLLGARCRSCHRRIAWQYPAVELITGLWFVFFFWQHLSFNWLTPEALLMLVGEPMFWVSLMRDWLAVAVFMVIFVFDARFYLVSNLVVIPAVILFVLLNLILGALWWSLLMTMAIAVAFFGIQFVLTRGRGLGEGDIWLGLLLGALFPQLDLLIVAIFSAYIMGTIVGLGLIAAGRKSWGSKLPLGVFLALGAILALSWGPELLAYYWGLF